MSKRRAYLSLGIAGVLLAAAIGVIAVLLLSDDSSEDSQEATTSPTAQQIDVASEELVLAKDLVGRIGTDVTPGELDRISVDADTLIAKSRSLEGSRISSQSLASAAISLRAGANKLSRVAETQRAGEDGLVEELVASDESATRMSFLSDELEGTTLDASEARRAVKRGLLQLRSAVSSIEEAMRSADELDDDSQQTFDDVRVRIRHLNRTLDRRFESLATRLTEISEGLAGRSTELEPDIVLDCPEIVPDGAGIYDVSVRNMSCSEAASLLGEFGPPAGFACSETGTGIESTSYRCTSGDRAIRYTVGA